MVGMGGGGGGGVGWRGKREEKTSGYIRQY